MDAVKSGRFYSGFYLCVFPFSNLYFIVFYNLWARFFLLSFVHRIFTFDLVVCVCMLFKSHSLLKYKVCSNKHVVRLLLCSGFSLSISVYFNLIHTLWHNWQHIVQPNKETQIQLAQKHLNSIQTHFIIMGVL